MYLHFKFLPAEEIHKKSAAKLTSYVVKHVLYVGIYSYF